MSSRALEWKERPEGKRHDVPAALATLASSYELSALLATLQREGVSLKDVRFDSREPDEVGAGREGSRIRFGPLGRLVRAVDWAQGDERPLVTIHLDVGLFSASSPLPSYFHRLLAEQGLGENLALLLRVLDHGLLAARARADALDYLRDCPWEALLRDALVGGSPRFVDWLFRRIFPELRVRVTWQMVPRRLGIDRAALGSATLGTCAFDGRGLVLRRGLEVMLTTQQDLEGPGGPKATAEPGGWVQEAKQRLERQILPRLRGRPVAMVVRLRILDGCRDARIDQARMGEDAMSRSPAPVVVTLFEGLAGARDVAAS